MKRLIWFTCVLLLPILGSAQLTHLQNVKITTPHPRILLTAGEEKVIQQNIDTSPTWKRVHQAILAESDRIVNLPPLQRIQIGRRLLDKSRECIRRIFYLSYAYRMTHEARYLQKAEAELVNIARFSDWNPSHFLDVAEMTMGVSIGYDWLYNDLSPASRAVIREAIITKGLAPSLDSKYNSWLRASHNWNQVCNAGMTFGALAVYEEQPEASLQLIDRAVESIRLPMADYNPAGAYPEGYGYWGYGTSFNVMFLSAIEKTFGTDFGLTQQSAITKTAGFLENMTGNTLKCFNYSDCGSGSGLNPAMFWLAKQAKDLSLLFTEKKYLENDSRLTQDRLLPALMIWGGGINLEEITAPRQLIWAASGKNPVGLMRSSWTDPNAIYVAIKGGSPSVNHAHMDIGSFVMDAAGQRWAMDFGSQDYESLESQKVDLWNMKQNSQRWEVLRYNNFYHNTLAFDQQLQRVAGYAPILGSTDRPDFLSATFDLSKVYADKAGAVKRGIAIVDRQYVVVRDEIEAGGTETTVRWTMVTPADVKVNNDGTALLTKNGKQLQLKVVEPANAVITTRPTTPLHDYDAPNPGTLLVGFDVKVPANSHCPVTVLLIPAGAQVSAAPVKALKEWGGK